MSAGRRKRTATAAVTLTRLSKTCWRGCQNPATFGQFVRSSLTVSPPQKPHSIGRAAGKRCAVQAAFYPEQAGYRFAPILAPPEQQSESPRFCRRITTNTQLLFSSAPVRRVISVGDLLQPEKRPFRLFRPGRCGAGAAPGRAEKTTVSLYVRLALRVWIGFPIKAGKRMAKRTVLGAVLGYRGPLLDPIFLIALQCCARDRNLDGSAAWADLPFPDCDRVSGKSASGIAIDADRKGRVGRARALRFYNFDATHGLPMPGDANGHMAPTVII
jgi:hypothetical protein